MLDFNKNSRKKVGFTTVGYFSLISPSCGPKKKTSQFCDILYALSKGLESV